MHACDTKGLDLARRRRVTAGVEIVDQADGIQRMIVLLVLKCRHAGNLVAACPMRGHPRRRRDRARLRWDSLHGTRLRWNCLNRARLLCAGLLWRKWTDRLTRL